MGHGFQEISPGSLLSRLQVKQDVGGIVIKLIQNYKDDQEDRLQEIWDYVQVQVSAGGGRRAEGRAGPGRAGQGLAAELHGLRVSVCRGLVIRVSVCA